MSLLNKTILLISPEPWDHIYVSKHHYAIHLAKRGNKVFYLNPPTNMSKVQETQYLNVFTVHYRGFVKGLQYFPGPIRKWFVKSVYNQLQILCQTSFDVVWSFDNSLFFDLDALPKEVLKISHIVDLNQDFQTKRAAASADYCFCTTQLIKSRLQKYNRKVTQINHGFNAPPSDEKPTPVSNLTTSVVYAGNLAMPYIDWILLRQIVASHPDVNFNFIGPDKVLDDQSSMGVAKKDVRDSSNTYFQGRIDSSDLQRFYRAADLLIIAYQEEFHDEQSNPHKMMEYLGSGRMIVASRTQEYAALAEKGLIAMSERNADYPRLFAKVLDDLCSWNDEVLQNARKAFAIENTYDKQIGRIMNIIDDN